MGQAVSARTPAALQKLNAQVLSIEGPGTGRRIEHRGVGAGRGGWICARCRGVSTVGVLRPRAQDDNDFLLSDWDQHRPGSFCSYTGGFSAVGAQDDRAGYGYSSFSIALEDVCDAQCEGFGINIRAVREDDDGEAVLGESLNGGAES